MKLVLALLAVAACSKTSSQCRTKIEKDIECDPTLTDIAKDKLRNGDVHMSATCEGYQACLATFDLIRAIDESSAK